ncbi:MAG: hypothetical protein M3R15_15660, partial [Acidobacteriota bacterium]|nr:hypothetical protein [Acidobacteriota bacterium]
MKNWAKLSLVGLGLVGTGVGLAILSGMSKWNGETARLVENMKRSASSKEATRVSFKDFDGLPVPVARYFRFALKDGQPLIRTARIRHEGEFNLNDKWIPFASTQDSSAHPPGFVWDADMRMNQLMNVRVRDGYVAGRGSMTAKVLSLVTMMDAHDDPKLDAGALQRYLAEAAWLPTALLPNENLKWTAIDDRKALATLSDSGTTVSLEFSFNETGEITGVFALERFREVNGEYKLFPWAGRFWNYQEKDGMMIPMEGEVEWQMPEGNAPYWKGQIVEAQYDFAQ